MKLLPVWKAAKILDVSESYARQLLTSICKATMLKPGSNEPRPCNQYGIKQILEVKNRKNIKPMRKLRSQSQLYRRKDIIDPRDDPDNVRLEPQKRGRMCPICRKVEVVTGQYICAGCRATKVEIDHGRVENNYVYS